MAVDQFGLVLANMLGYTGDTAPLVGTALKPFFYAVVALGIITIILLIIIILVARGTNGFKELKARMGGKRICLFFDDTRNVEMRPNTPKAGMITDESYGSFIIHEEGAYVDKKTRNIYMCFDVNQSMGASVKHFNAANKLTYILGDPKRLEILSLAIANGEVVDKDFDCLKTNLNFSSLRSFANAMLPHNIEAQINMEIAERMKSTGQGGAKQIMWFVIVGMGLIAVMALVLWMVLGQKGGTTTNIITTAGNMTRGLIS